jgi:RNA polymerase sigma-70 factor (ECF subfamily)
MDAARDELESLLKEMRWVSALARRLVGGSAADDVAQEAWVVALEQPPRHARARRTWFARVLQNLARQRARVENARRGRERSVARSEAHVESEVIERVETSRRLVEHVLALEDPYRSVVLARYFEGLAPDQIAERGGVNGSTVRTRLERGLAKLREKLERDGGRTWMAMLAPVAHEPHWATPGALATGTANTATAKAVTAKAAAADLVATGTSYVPMAIAGGLLMTAAGKATLAAVTLALAAWWMWSGETDTSSQVASAPPAEAPRESSSSAPRIEATRKSVDPPAETTLSERSAQPLRPSNELDDAALLAELDAEVAPGAIEGLVLRGRTPVSGGEVYFWTGHWRTLPADPSAQLGSDLDVRPIGHDGRFRVAPLEPNWYSLGIAPEREIGAQLYVQVHGDRSSRRVVIQLGTARIEGFVYDEEGRPVEGAAVRVTTKSNRRDFERYAVSARDGSYSVDELTPGSGWIAIDRSGTRGREATIGGMQQFASLSRGESRRIDFGSPERSSVWTGRLVSRSGAPVPLSGRLGHQPAPNGPYSEVALEGGVFELRLAPGKHRLQVTLAAKSGRHGTGYLQLGEFEVGVSDFARDLVLPGAVVRGQLRGFVLDEGTRQNYVALRDDERHESRTADIAPDGSFAFFAVPHGDWRVQLPAEFKLTGEPRVRVLESDLELSVDVQIHSQ